MADITLHSALLSGVIAAPPSKSMAHRMLICAALADGISRISPIQPSGDILATIDGLCALGAECTLDGDTAVVRGIGDHRPKAPVSINCRESGSTLRFLLPLSLTVGVGGYFSGAPGLAVRPLTPYRDICAAKGIFYSHAALPHLSSASLGKLPAGRYDVPGNISSQFITGLLLALSMLEADSEIRLTTPLESASYVDLTLDAMRAFGVQVHVTPAGYLIPGGQKYTARNAVVEGDYSQAAHWLCAAALGSDISVSGLSPNSRQGDAAILDILRAMGASVDSKGNAVRIHANRLNRIDIDVSGIPDIAPVIALTCCFADGTSRIRGAGRLRIKECDRLSATVQAIRTMGGRAEETADEMVIHGVPLTGGNRCACQNDHRMAMLYAVASTRCPLPLTLDSRECVCKSYPRFWDDFSALGGMIE